MEIIQPMVWNKISKFEQYTPVFLFAHPAHIQSMFYDWCNGRPHEYMYYCIMKSIFPVLSVDRTGMELKRNHCVIIHPSIFYSINLLLEFSHASQRYLINLPHRIGAPRK